MIYDKRRGTYRCERRKWETDGQRLSFGKTYLQITNNGHLRSGAWVTLEWIIPSALLLSGQTICISGLCNMISSNSSIAIGGRYELGDGRQLTWPDQYISLPSDFEHWNSVITCPAIEKTELHRGHTSRILLKIICDQPFEFCLTNFQVEIGTNSTDFTYNNSAFSLRERLNILWKKTKVIGKQSNFVCAARQLS